MPDARCAAPSAERNLSGAGLTLAAFLFVACMSAAVKGVERAGPGLPALQVAFLRYLGGTCVLAPLVLLRGPRHVLRTPVLPLHLARIGSGYVGVVCYYAALAGLPLADANALAFTSPFFAMAFAALVLRERVGLARWSAAGVAFGGVLILLRPGTEVQVASLLALVTAVCFGVESGLIKLLSGRDAPLRILFYCNLLGALLGLGPALATWRAPNAAQWLLLAMLGPLILCAQALFLYANRRAESNFLAPFQFSTLVYAALLGLLFFAEVPTIHTLLGSLLIGGSYLYVSARARTTRSPG